MTGTGGRVQTEEKTAKRRFKKKLVSCVDVAQKMTLECLVVAPIFRQKWRQQVDVAQKMTFQNEAFDPNCR